MQDKNYWQVLISEQKQSGKGVAEYCRELGIKDSQFYAWRKRLEVESEAKFVSVSSSERITLELRNGVNIKVSTTDLGPVLKALCAQ